MLLSKPKTFFSHFSLKPMFSFPSFYLITTLLFTTIPLNKSQPFSPRLLDSILQEHAFQPLSGHRTKTGVIYSGNVPSNLTGTSIAALRLRSGSLRRRGYSKYNEFCIPKGVVVSPYVKRVILVYHNLGNWSNVYYPLKGYVYLSSVVGLLVYNASDVYAKELQELDVRVSEYPVSVKFGDLKVDLPHGVLPKCVFFDLFGGVEFEKLVNGSVCVSVNQGHFGVVVEDGSVVASAPAVAPPPAKPIASGGGGGGGGGGRKRWWVGGVVGGGVVLAVLVVVMVLWVRWLTGRKRVCKMRNAAESGVPLAVAAVGRAKVPVAMGTRTKPILENEFVS